MANTKSAKKQIRVTERNRLRNTRYRTMLKNAVKNARTAIAGEDAEAAQTAVNSAVATLYKSVNRGIIHRGNAQRRVSRIMTAYNRQFNQQQAAG